MPTAADITAITSVVAFTTIIGGIVAMGGVKVLPNAVKWGVNKLASMFG